MKLILKSSGALFRFVSPEAEAIFYQCFSRGQMMTAKFQVGDKLHSEQVGGTVEIEQIQEGKAEGRYLIQFDGNGKRERAWVLESDLGTPPFEKGWGPPVLVDDNESKIMAELEAEHAAAKKTADAKLSEPAKAPYA